MPEYSVQSEQHWIDQFSAQISTLIEKHPHLSSVDMVIEGGVGYGTLMRNVIKRVFPQAFYVGMDLASVDSQKSQLRTIDDEILQLLLTEKAHIILANCFDNELVNDIAQKTGRKTPLLFSVNSLAALLDYFLQGDYQKHEDYVPVDEWFTPQVPYVGHIHLYREEKVWEKVAAREFPFGFDKVMKVATTPHWTCEQMPSGLAVIKNLQQVAKVL